MPKNRVPTLVKHMTMAIYKKGGIEGSTKKERFISAWNIARARLVEYGFLGNGSEEGPASNISLTGRGRKRDQLHNRESDSTMKNKQFDALFEVLQDKEISGKAE